ncbi:hypothetical protein B0T17DRAFT_500575 [Bombardia bombarda]|uniref:MI domain-containing protein n=1 Tax=Bombardia bombarda TaxID=252184 RepID=A0AA39TRP3_9PEZI|nr:hypothetical protein B0T17DRAFT_500575 [Bombardia bombarda]
MVASGKNKPQLPLRILKELGTSDSGGREGRGKGRGAPVNRKEQRKAQRTEKKVQRNTSSRSYAERATAPPPPGRHTQHRTPTSSAKPGKKEPKPILKQRKPAPKAIEEEEDDDEDEDMDDEDILLDEGSDSDEEDGFGFLDEDSEGDVDDDLGEGDDDEDEGEEDEDEDEEETNPAPKKSSVSKALLRGLEEDDAEIAALEKKLGLKGRRTLPQAFHDDGLGELLGELEGGGGADDETVERKKRKAEADDWLAMKRRKAAGKAAEEQRTARDLDDSEDGSDGDGSDEDMLDGESDEYGSDEDEDMDGDEDDFGGFDSNDEDAQKPEKRVRENPYVAPTVPQAAVKYVPPSLRKETGSDAELTARIRRQTQGLVNRITESNMTSILIEIEKLYRDNPRQHLTSTLVDLILIQVCEPTSLPDTLLILSAGFATAVYRVIGMDFGAQLIQEVVERFARHYEEARIASIDRPDVSKHTSNIITFLSQLYNFQLIGPNLLFDYIRFLLDDLSELNAELLLRIIRMSGPALRQDDPMALKDIVALIRPAMAKIGENNLSVRTKFMIETINDLKNNKMKTGVTASAVLSEHATRMKKLLGTLSTRKLSSTEPLRMGLKDIRDSDKKGKWWLVGASWAGPGASEKNKKKSAQEEDGDDNDSDNEGLLLDDDMDGAPDLGELARENMMNTDVRRSIFVSILSATDYEDAYFRILKLRLNKERQREIPTVIIQCTGAEQQYNPYYTLIARKLCTDRKVRWSFQDSLWRLFRRLGESVFGDGAEDEDEDDAIDMRRLVNIAKLFGSLVASGDLSLAILKCLNLPYLQAKTRAFVEVLLITTLLECRGADAKEDALPAAFMAAGANPELARGLQWFLKKVVRKSDLAGSKADTKVVKEACRQAQEVLETALVSNQGLGD